jgi:hypothetical protein
VKGLKLKGLPQLWSAEITVSTTILCKNFLPVSTMLSTTSSWSMYIQFSSGQRSRWQLHVAVDFTPVSTHGRGA